MVVNGNALTLGRTCPNYFHILQNVQVSSGLSHFFSYHVHRHTDRHTATHRHKYSIYVVDIKNYKNCDMLN